MKITQFEKKEKLIRQRIKFSEDLQLSFLNCNKKE